MGTSSKRVLGAALLLGWLTDYLFYGHAPGISVPLFVLLLLGTLVDLGRVEGVAVSRNLWLAVPAIFFALMTAVRANTTLTLTNILAVFTLVSLLFFFYSADRIERLNLPGYPAVLALAGVALLTRAVPDVSDAAKAAGAHKHKLRLAAPVVRGVILAVPLLLLFTILLSSADSVFGGLVGDLFKIDFFSSFPETTMRFILVLVAAWLIAGGFLYALRRREDGGPRSGRGPGGALPGEMMVDRKLGLTEAATVMGLVIALFAVFAWIQVTYLFSGEAARTMNYEAFREYVRRGFGELVVVAVLTMALILGLRWLAHYETRREIRIFNTLSTAMVGLAILMLVSAMVRMVVWEGIEFYINTQVRLYVRVFIVWLGVLFLWLLVALWFRRDRFAIGALAAAIGFMVTVNIINPDADVAAYNLRRNDELSTRFLYLLSDDAVPALVAGLDHTSGGVQANLRWNLSNRLQRLSDEHTSEGWQSFHLAREQAYEMLSRLAAQGKIDAPLPLPRPVQAQTYPPMPVPTAYPPVYLPMPPPVQIFTYVPAPQGTPWSGSAGFPIDMNASTPRGSQKPASR